jgi:hypothetical protein
MIAAEDVYLSEPHPTRRQGDIVLAPTSVLWAPERVGAVADVPLPPAHMGQPVFSMAAQAPAGAPWVLGVHETRWSPAIILSHDCDIEKDFNERVHALVDGGMDVDEACREASDDLTLDPLIVVAPLMTYDAVPEGRRQGIRQAQRIGYFPLPPLPGAGETEYLVDLGRVTSVDHLLFGAKLASLTHGAAGVLRYKISEANASRDLSVLRELEALVGETIASVEAIPKSAKKTALALSLMSGNTVHLEIRRPHDEQAAEITRATPKRGA